jgi:molecular chaperone GrpE (heat shock protein)
VRKQVVKQPAKKQRKAAGSGTNSRTAKARVVRAQAEAPEERPAPPVAQPVEAMLDGAAESLRRLLGELLEQRLEAVAREAAAVHREVAAGADRERVLGLLDDLLQGLGASRFTAQPLDVVDPLIHAVVEERRADGVPSGVILEAVRPGFRSGRGLVLARAAVTVSGE